MNTKLVLVPVLLNGTRQIFLCVWLLAALAVIADLNACTYVPWQEIVQRAVGDGKHVFRPTIEELIWQIGEFSDEQVDLKADPFRLLRIGATLEWNGTMRSQPTTLNRVAEGFLQAASYRLDNSGFETFWNETRNPEGEHFEKFQKHVETLNDLIFRERRGLIDEKAYQADYLQEIVDFEKFIWAEFRTTMPPYVVRQLDYLLIQAEIRSAGFVTAFKHGHLAQELRSALGQSEIDLLREEFGAFEKALIINGTPQLMLVPRQMLFPN